LPVLSESGTYDRKEAEHGGKEDSASASEEVVQWIGKPAAAVREWVNICVEEMPRR